MGTVWRLMLRELVNQEWKVWLFLPLPLLLFGGLLHSRLEVSPFTIAIALTAFCVMQANLHRRMARRSDGAAGRLASDRPTDGREASGREKLLAIYAMTFVWFVLAAIICNAAWAVYALVVGGGFRLSGPEELTTALAALLAATGISLPLRCWLGDRASVLVSVLFVTGIWSAADIARAVPDALVRSPLPLLAAGAIVFALSWWPAYLGLRRTSGA